MPEPALLEGAVGGDNFVHFRPSKRYVWVDLNDDSSEGEPPPKDTQVFCSGLYEIAGLPSTGSDSTPGT